MKIKWRKDLSLEELQKIFQEWAQAFNEATFPFKGKRISLPSRAFFKADLKEAEGTLELKIKIYFPLEKDTIKNLNFSGKKNISQSPKEKGKEIKKTMDYLFKEVVNLVERDQTPPVYKIDELIKLHEAYDPWVKDSFRSGWEASKQLCSLLKEQVSNNNLDEIKLTLDKLYRLKKSCHKIHK